MTNQDDQTIVGNFIQKMIEQQANLHQIATQKEFEDDFISTTIKDISNRLKKDKEYLKNYYLKQYSIKKAFQEKNEPRAPPQKEKTSFFSFFGKSKDKESENTNRFAFTLKECVTIEQYEGNLKQIDNPENFTSIDNNNYINLFAFSTIPSYFNFFLTENNVNDFIIFLQQISELQTSKIYLEIYSSIIYHTPLFLNFCHEVIFKSVIIECIHNPDKISSYSQKQTFYDTVIESIQANHHLCPPLLKRFFETFSHKDNFSLSDHIKNYFLSPLFDCPLQFSVIREFDFLPESFFTEIKKDSPDTKSHIDNLIETIIAIPLNPKLYIDEPKDKTYRIFTSFDIDIINNFESIVGMKFNDYSFSYVSENPKKQDRGSEETNFFKDQHIKIFRELLRLADPLPLQIKTPNSIEGVMKIMEHYLVDIGDLQTQIERNLCFANFKGNIKDINSFQFYINEMNEPTFLNEQSLNEKQKMLNEVYKNGNQMKVISSLIMHQIEHINAVYKILKSSTYNDKNIVSYNQSEMQKIVKNPQIIIDDYNEYLRRFGNLQLDDFEKSVYYYRKLANLRFSDFLKSHGNLLEEYDSLTSSFVKCNRDQMINEILSKKTSRQLNDLVYHNSYLLLPFIEDLSIIFDENGSPFEKFGDIINIIRKSGNFFDEVGPDMMTDFFQIITIKTNCNHLLSNFAFLENFYFKIFPTVNSGNMRRIFSFILNKIFPMEENCFYSTIAPFIAKTLNGLYFTYEGEAKSKIERLFFTSPYTFKTYIVIMNYTNSQANLYNYDIVVTFGKKSAFILKKNNNDIKIAICNNGEKPEDMKLGNDVIIRESKVSCLKELGNDIFKKYEPQQY